jgi:hypothetical protein
VCLGDELPRTAIPKVCDSAGIDNIDICVVAKVTLHKTSGTQLFADGLTICLIDFAAQSSDCKRRFF